MVSRELDEGLIARTLIAYRQREEWGKGGGTEGKSGTFLENASVNFPTIINVGSRRPMTRAIAAKAPVDLFEYACLLAIHWKISCDEKPEMQI